MVIAETVEALANMTGPYEGEAHAHRTMAPTLRSIRDEAERAETTALSPPSYDELTMATQLIKGHSVVQVPGKSLRTTLSSLKQELC